MNRADRKHKNLVIEMLTDSFDENKSVNYVVKPGTNRRDRIKNLMSYSFEVCNKFGDVWISDDLNTCALVLLPDRKKFTISGVYWDLKLALSVIGLGRIGKVMGRESKIKARHPMLPFAYLWFIGVKRSFQNQGIGTKLLHEILEIYRAANRPIYLETSVDRNLPWYTKNGFELFESLELSYPLYFLRKSVV